MSYQPVAESDVILGSGNVLEPGMMLSLKDAMRRALWKSDNDCCEFIARIVGANFVGDRFYNSIIVPTV